MASQTREARPRLLIVDDEEAILLATGEYFAAQGFEVDGARDLAEAHRHLDRHVYAAVIADLRLSGTQSLEGLELLDLVHQRSRATHTVIVTAYGTEEAERDAYRRGAAAFFHKPVRLGDLARVVGRLVAPDQRAAQDRGLQGTEAQTEDQDLRGG